MTFRLHALPKHGAFMDKRRLLGQWDTIADPFFFEPAKAWLDEIGQLGLPVVEPFCGVGNIVRLLPTVNWAGFYDIHPRDHGEINVEQRDTLSDFPLKSSSGVSFGAVITNPPWLSRRSATSRGLESNAKVHDDLYKEALSVCLANVGWVAAIIPESFMTGGLFKNRLRTVISLPFDIFGGETEHPACLALFVPMESGDPEVWRGNKYLGRFSELSKHPVLTLQKSQVLRPLFNTPSGRIAVFGMDSRSGATIRFDHGYTIDPNRIKRSSRHNVRLDFDFELRPDDITHLINTANLILSDFRTVTCDTSLTATRARRRDGPFRRRLDFDKIARILTLALMTLGLLPR